MADRPAMQSDSPPAKRPMEKYRKVQKAKEVSPPDEIRVTGSGHVRNYVTYTARLFNEMEHNSIAIRATGKAISTAVSVAEIVKRRFKGLHQVTTVGCTRMMNEYEPLEEGLDRIEETRIVSFISIQLARDAAAEKMDKEHPGYQPPLDDSLVKELDHDAVARPVRPRGRGRGGGRGRGFRGGYGAYGRGGGGRGRGGRGGPMMGNGADQSGGAVMGGTGGGMYDDFDPGYSYNQGAEYRRGGRSRRGRGGGMGGGEFRGGGGFRGRGGSYRGRGRGGGQGGHGDDMMNGPAYMDATMPMGGGVPGYPSGAAY